MEHEGIIDYVDDDEEEEGEEEGVDDSGKKRMRKPVKARSLKSLMWRNEERKKEKIVGNEI